jgi:hypothetical protein
MVHLDNCSVDTNLASTDSLEENGIRRMPHPLSSPDFARSDFDVFPTVKEKLERIEMADEHEFVECLQEILRDIDQQELNGVFQAWVRCVQELSQGKAQQ